jgi:hypothetical protein
MVFNSVERGIAFPEASMASRGGGFAPLSIFLPALGPFPFYSGDICPSTETVSPDPTTTGIVRSG